MTMLTQATADKIIGEIAKPVSLEVPFAFTPSEIAILQNHPGALLILMQHHEEQQNIADAMWDAEYRPQGNEIRYQQLKREGRNIIASDPDEWPDSLCMDFGFPSTLNRR